MPDTIPANTSTTATLSVDSYAASSIDHDGDADWWRVSLSEGYGYYAGVAGASTGYGTLYDPLIVVTDAYGSLLGWDDDGDTGYDALAYIVPDYSGTHYLVARESGDNGSGSYTIYLRADVLDDTATAASLGVGGALAGTIDLAGDEDWYAISLVAGQTYVFTLAGSASSAGTLDDPLLGLADAGGAAVRIDLAASPGSDSQLLFTPATSGTYYLAAAAYGDADSGSYTLSAANVGSIATPLALGGRAGGSLQGAGEADFYRIAAAASSLLTIAFDAPAAAPEDAFEIRVFDAAGNLLTRWQSGADFSFEVGAAAGGTLYVEVDAGAAHSSGQYALSASAQSVNYATGPTAAILPLTGDTLVDATTHGYFWSLDPSHTVTWAIADFTSYWIDPAGALLAIEDIFSQYEAVADIHFRSLGYYSSVEGARDAGADIVVSLDGSNVFFSSPYTWAMAFFPTTQYATTPYEGAAGDLWINTLSQANSISYDPGAAGYFLVLHELGHALGLKHPHDDGGTGHPTYAQAGIGDFDIDVMTVMSYEDDYDFNTVAWDPATPMALDVLAMQALYGPNLGTHAGNSQHVLVADDYYQSVWDASGRDTVTAAASPEGWVIQLPVYVLSSIATSPVGFALPASESGNASPATLYWLIGDIEDASGSAADDVIVGNDGNNRIFGLGGNDLLDGYDGNDTIGGGAGSDTVYYDEAAAGVRVYLWQTTRQNTLGAGSDTLFGIENLIGSAHADTLGGNAAANLIDGGDGNDTLIGSGGGDTLGGDAGNDLLNGGAGADLLTGGAGADVFLLTHAAASDTITDFASGSDRLRIKMSAIRVGDGDAMVENAASIAGPGGFARGAELVIVTADIAGAITAASASAAIGSATAAYATGAKRLFVVDNGNSSALFLFTSSGADAAVSAAELTQLASLSGTAATALADYVFAA